MKLAEPTDPLFNPLLILGFPLNFQRNIHGSILIYRGMIFYWVDITR